MQDKIIQVGRSAQKTVCVKDIKPMLVTSNLTF